MTALEREVAKRGGVMIYLGSDDEHNTTSLFGVDLYEDTFDKITNIKNTGGHPYTFYEKHGYKTSRRPPRRQRPRQTRYLPRQTSRTRLKGLLPGELWYNGRNLNRKG